MVETVFSVFDQLANSCPSRFFGANAIVGAKHHGTVRGAHRERVPRTGDHDGVAVDRRSPEGGRSAGGPRAGVSALRCVPHRARASRHLRRADRRPTDDPLPRRRRPERHDGVHQRADSQRGVVTGYVALLSPAKRAATPRGLPAVRPFRVRARGRGVAESRPVPDRDTISFRPDGRRRDECARDARTTRTAFRASFPDSRRPSGYGAMRTPSRVTAHAPRSRAFRPRRDDFRERQGEPADWRAGQRRELVSGHRVRVRRERRAT